VGAESGVDAPLAFDGFEITRKIQTGCDACPQTSLAALSIEGRVFAGPSGQRGDTGAL
jgi:hypothetical protein